MRAMKKTLVFLLLTIMMLSIATVQAEAKSYKANKVTAQQIVTQLKTTGLIKKAWKPSSKELMDPSTPNAYKSKYNYTDKEYSDVYCTVEVFDDNFDAVRRQSYIDILSFFYGTFGMEEDVPLQAYRYKNVLLRVGSKMPLKHVLKYYNTMKKVIK